MSDVETTAGADEAPAEARRRAESHRDRRGHRARSTTVADVKASQPDLTPEELIAAMEASFRDFNDGDIVEGEVVKIDRDEVLLDIGYKSEGVIPSKELSIRHDVDPNEVVKVGERLEALVLQKEDKEGRLILSKKRAQYERAWGRIEEVMTSGQTIKGPVIEVVKGGLILDIGLRGFLPASLVDLRRVRDLHPFVGQELEAKIIELDRNRNNVVLSRRAFLEESQSEGRKSFLQSLQKGERRKGTVSSIVNFGAFVDLGGVDGLVHVSELSWKHVDHPGEVVAVGQEVEVEVLDVDLERERVSLSPQGHAGGPLEGVRAHVAGRLGHHRAGHEARAVRGVHPRRARGSKASCTSPSSRHEHVDTPESVLSVGDEVQVKVIDVEVNRRRVSLSMRQVTTAAAARARDQGRARAASRAAARDDVDDPDPRRHRGGGGGGGRRPRRRAGARAGRGPSRSPPEAVAATEEAVEVAGGRRPSWRRDRRGRGRARGRGSRRRGGGRRRDRRRGGRR